MDRHKEDHRQGQGTQGLEKLWQELVVPVWFGLAFTQDAVSVWEQRGVGAVVQENTEKKLGNDCVGIQEYLASW